MYPVAPLQPLHPTSAFYDTRRPTVPRTHLTSPYLPSASQHHSSLCQLYQLTPSLSTLQIRLTLVPWLAPRLVGGHSNLRNLGISYTAHDPRSNTSPHLTSTPIARPRPESQVFLFLPFRRPVCALPRAPPAYASPHLHTTHDNDPRTRRLRDFDDPASLPSLTGLCLLSPRHSP